MPFTVPYAASNVYQPNGRLVDLIRLHGEQTADAQRRAGEIQAQMWGNLASTIQAGANSVIKARADAPIAALNALKVADATHEAHGKTALADTMRMQATNGPMQPGESRPAPSNPYLKQEGDVSVWDVEGLSKAMASQGFGDLTSSVVKDIGSLNDAHRAEAKARRDFGDAQQNVLARGAGTILSILKDHPDADPSVVTNLVGQQMAANSTFPPAQIQQTIQQLLSDPTTLRTKLETLSRLGTVAPIKLGKDDVLLSGTNPTAPPIASNIVPEKPTDASLAATAKDPTKTPEQRAAAQAALDALQKPTVDARVETARHDKEMERISGLTAGREAAAQAETVRHNKAMEAANNPLAALTGGGGAAPANAAQAEGAHGDAFLKTLPQNVASEVKAYAEGRRPFPAGFALKSPYFQSLIQMVGQYDPTFDAVNYNARSKTRNDFTSGKASQTINALNTVTQHLDRLSDSADALNNSWSPTYNTVANFLLRKTGNQDVTRFETDKKAVVDELTRAWRQSGGTEGDIKSWSSVLDAANSPAQLHGAIAEMGQLLEGKLSAMQSQYAQGMGTTDTTGLQVVTPKARSVLTKLEQRAGGGAATSSSVPAEGTKGTVGGRAATWKTVNGKLGWYAD